MEQRNCVVCSNDTFSLVYSNYPGYVDGSYFDIYKCQNCDSHFIACENSVNDLYDLIYCSGNTYGYDRYYTYMQTIKDQKDPLRYLAYNESAYYPVYNYLKDKKGLKILDVGCGYGYLSYALRQKGFISIGIDIAANAINMAKQHFGNYYFNTDLESFTRDADSKFDLIIATELVEHLDDPNSFIDNCLKLLTENGKIILTTPDKDYYKVNTVWMTDLPPVHVSWIGKKGMKILAQKHNLKSAFTDFSKYYSKHENRLIRFLRTRNELIASPTLTKEGEPINKVSENQPFLYKTAVFFFHRIPFIRFTSNFIHNMLINKEATLGVILEK